MTFDASSDPFTISVIQAGFEAAAQEMFDTLRKTAMSPIIYEVLDVGTGVLDAEGALVSSGAGIPGFIGVLDKSVKAIIARVDHFADGDVFILNDPNYGGVTHLNDVVLAMPVFFDGNVVGWTASIAHWGDIGGKTPGSMAVDVSEIVAEGLRLPPIRLFQAGKRNEAVFDIILANTRLPDFVTGDLMAQLSAVRRGARVVQELFQRYGAKTVENAKLSGFAEAHARAKVGLRHLPKGRHPVTATQDDGSVWKVTIDITDDTFVVDLRDAPDALASPHNTSRDGALVACQILFKSLTDSRGAANEASFAPLKVLTRPGSIFHAGPTSPQGYYFETRIRLFDLLWQAMARAMPERLPMGHFASIYGTVIAGVHPQTGRKYTLVEPQMGGWGATTDRDGTGPQFSSSHGDTFNCPVEVAEARYGLDVVEHRLNQAPRRAAGFTGGPGIVKRYRLNGAAMLSAGFSYAVVPVWSTQENGHGGRNQLVVHRSDQSRSELQFVSGYDLMPGDEVEIVTAYGGST